MITVSPRNPVDQDAAVLVGSSSGAQYVASRPGSSGMHFRIGFWRSVSGIFTVCLCAFILNIGYVLGYTTGLLAILERNLHCSSTVIGIIFSCLFIGLIGGYLVVIFFTPQNKPRWLCGSLILTGTFIIFSGVAASVQRIPQPVSGLKAPVILCDESFLSINRSLDPQRTQLGSLALTDNDVLYLLAAFLSITGFMAALPFTIVLTKLHTDFQGRKHLITCTVLGPFFGLLFAALGSIASHIGRFVLGFLFPGIIVFIIGLTIGVLTKSSLVGVMSPLDDRIPGINISIKNTARTLAVIIKKWTFSGLVAIFLLDTFLTVGYLFILPRYLQIQFDVPPFVSSLAAASFFVLPVTCGALGISYGARYLQSSVTHSRMISVACVGVSCLGFLIFVFLGCGTKEFDHKLQRVIEQERPLIITNICNKKCDCFRSETFFRPVCHEGTDVTYASPCLAGCMRMGPRSNLYEHCHCVENKGRTDQLPANSTMVKEGFCSRNCRVAYSSFTFLMFLFHLLVGFPPYNILTQFRRLFFEPETYLTASRLVTFLFLLLILIPAPLMAGVLLDSTCDLWDPLDTLKNGITQCVHYNAERLRTRIHIPLLFWKFILTALYYLVRQTSLWIL
ncbi:hypothetical protein RvY_06045-2 [Ramazzottius varieornatus]|uniref:Kazal-like domain-containing protein n=1 Tax=Ramazzottius varieornatus TaxID=947166 RepID=A0A1D1V058_RAMVA|nr:hypothetical protein RvY_06045-2 [Ramazzottius varieornatus]